MINVYALDCRPYLDEACATNTLPLLDATRRARAQRLQNVQKKAQLLAAGVLLYRLFGKNGQPPQLTHGSRGKPYLADNSAFFSLSHTDEWVFCAVADSETGLDAQVDTPYNAKIAERWFTPSEKAWLADDPNSRFAALWARKEAFAKFTGFGLVLPMSSFTVPTTDGTDEDNHCFWKSYDFPTENKTIRIAVCCGREDSLNEIKIIE
ncbi:MAG: 4'-phosphopantetheinyl transferase superfamily protein [Clostridia bacterium]|nr:4'-phosphopantetheinyl transferase superfamily protein [Clostridia bacterium]